MQKDIRDLIFDTISTFIRNHEKREDIRTKWGTPLVGYASARDPYIKSLKEIISPSHGQPEDVLTGAKTVIAYYIPFTKELSDTNKDASALASKEWAIAYEETNAMFRLINSRLIEVLAENGIRANSAGFASSYDTNALISDWSHRHFAYAAGLGTFGINNMLITENGCCGRFNSIVTDMDIEPDKRPEDELCLYKVNGTCEVCIKRCPVNALTLKGFDRRKCYAHLRINAKHHSSYGSTYGEEGSTVCGKCVVSLPCSFKRPYLKK